jgi:hypothetical protein
VVALVVASLVLGLFLARFNVFAALVATAICVIGSFIYDMTSGLTLAHFQLASLAPAFVLQVGYLVGQFLWRPRK